MNEEIWVILDSQGTELAELPLKGLQNEDIYSNIDTNLKGDFYFKIFTSFKN